MNIYDYFMKIINSFLCEKKWYILCNGIKPHRVHFEKYHSVKIDSWGMGEGWRAGKRFFTGTQLYIQGLTKKLHTPRICSWLWASKEILTVLPGWRLFLKSLYLKNFPEYKVSFVSRCVMFFNFIVVHWGGITRLVLIIVVSCLFPIQSGDGSVNLSQELRKRDTGPRPARC